MRSCGALMLLLNCFAFFPPFQQYSCCHGFSFKLPDFFSPQQQQQPSPNNNSKQDRAARARQLLADLNVNPEEPPPLLPQIPGLLSASVVAALRGASGVFASDYRLGWTGRTGASAATDDNSNNDDDESKQYYSYVRLGGLGQLRETGFCRAPALPLQLYDLESDAACRLVREACSMLSLTVTFLPATGPHYRPEIAQKFPGFPDDGDGFPYLLDPNAAVRLSGRRGILEYLFASYGSDPRVPSSLMQQSDWPLWTANLGLKLFRLGAGGRHRPSSFDYATPGRPLRLWAYEGSPFCKVVREALCELELPHTCAYAPRGSPNRQALFERTGGRFQVPYLEDPNTGVELFESAVICDYLRKRYGLAPPKAKL